MTRLLLVRHARPASDWDAGGDPGLDQVGHAQAGAVAAALAGHTSAVVASSPRRRALETAAPIAAALGVVAAIESAAGEIPSATGDPARRGSWLRETLAQRWSRLDGGLRAWRSALIEMLVATDRDTILVSHFVAINAAVGAATGDDRVMSFSPAYASITELAVRNQRLELVRRGDEAATAVG